MKSIYDIVNKIADELDVMFDRIKCGRLRWPINIDGDKQTIEGMCSLDWKDCKYKYPLGYCQRLEDWRRDGYKQ